MSQHNRGVRDALIQSGALHSDPARAADQIGVGHASVVLRKQAEDISLGFVQHIADFDFRISPDSFAVHRKPRQLPAKLQQSCIGRQRIQHPAKARAYFSGSQRVGHSQHFYNAAYHSIRGHLGKPKPTRASIQPSEIAGSRQYGFEQVQLTPNVTAFGSSCPACGEICHSITAHPVTSRGDDMPKTRILSRNDKSPAVQIRNAKRNGAPQQSRNFDNSFEAEYCSSQALCL